MKGSIFPTIIEETFCIQINKLGWMPHDFDSIRRRLSSCLSHPDDVQALLISTCKKKHLYVEHYRHKIGNESAIMIQKLLIRYKYKIKFIDD